MLTNFPLTYLKLSEMPWRYHAGSLHPKVCVWEGWYSLGKQMGFLVCKYKGAPPPPPTPQYILFIKIIKP